MENKIELLSPAGNIDSFKAAINAGADAIYMGVDKFNARQMAKNFNEDEYIYCIKYAHILDVNVYLTINTLLHDDEIDDAINLVIKLYENGLDAIIVQDIGFMSIIHKILPELSIHVSTQMSVYNLEQVKFLEHLGAKRVVLARELSLKEIEYICSNTTAEIEIFVHGALCVSYSGQCMLSNVIGNRSANRGECAQPCRMKYSLYNSNNEVVVSNKYILSKKDIYGLPYLNELKKIGVKSLKIEGRNKTPEYVAQVTKTYRKYIDNIEYEKINFKDEYELKQIFNRDSFSDGYFNGPRYKESITRLPKNTGIYLGKVIDIKNRYIKIRLEDNVSMHDGIEIISNDGIKASTIVTCILDKNSKILNQTMDIGEIVFIGDINKKVNVGDFVYKTSSYILNKSLKKFFDGTYQKRRKVDINLVLKKEEPVSVATNNLKYNVNVKLDYVPEEAKNKAVKKESIIECFSKTLDTLLEFNLLNIEMDDNIFIPLSIMNELRKKLISSIDESFDQKKVFEKKIEYKKEYESYKKLNNKSLIGEILYIYRFDKKIDYFKYYKEKYNNKLDTVYIDIHDMYKNEKEIFALFKEKVNIYVVLPNVCSSKVDEYIYNRLEYLVKIGVKGIIVGNVGYIDSVVNLKKKYSDLVLIADYSLNIFNKYSAILYNDFNFDVLCPSLELDRKEIIDIQKVSNIEMVKDYITVMTTRYCPLASYVAKRKADTKCSMPCLRDNYYLTDYKNKKYYIVSSNIDCITKIVAKKAELNDFDLRSRKCII